MLELSTNLLYTVPILVIVNYIFQRLTRKKTWLDDVPTYGLGKGPGLIGRLSGIINMFTHGAECVAAGMRDCDSQDKVFRVPNMFNGFIYVVPFKYIAEMRNKPNDVLDFLGAVDATVGSKSTALHNAVIENEYHTNAVQIALTKNFQTIVPQLEEELAYAINRELGKKEAESKDGWIKLDRNVMLDIIACTTNKTITGLPYCRDKDLTEMFKGYAMDIVLGGVFMIMFPKKLRPLVSPFVNLRNRWRWWRITKKLRPMLEERIKKTIEYSKAKAEGRSKEPLPEDLIQAMLNLAEKANELKPDLIALRLLIVNFAAIHTTTIGVMQLLYSAAYEKGPSDKHGYYIPHLLQEIKEVYSREVEPNLTPSQIASRDPNFLPESSGWNPKSLINLTSLDSFMRECFRFYMLGPLTMVRQVRHPNGFTLSNGWHFPKGTLIGCPSLPVSMSDEEIEDPTKFDAFRCKRALEESGKSPEEMAGLQCSSITGKYVVFSTGRHACPGRFFAVNEIKLLFKHLLINYEIEPISERPQSSFLFNNQLDNILAEGVRIRRRKSW